jgi:hypothetical protein
MRICYVILFLFFSAAACNQNEIGESLSAKNIVLLKKLGLLNEPETIFLFYSQYKKSVAGNFITDKRLASYWIDEHNPAKNKINFAWYPDIIRIDTNYMHTSFTLTPYLEVTTKDSTRFRLASGGSTKEVRAFFEEALKRWQQN